MHQPTKLITLLLLLMGASFGAQAQLHKWTDANGKVHYSNQPAPGSQEVKVRPPPSGDASKADSSWKEREAEYRKRKAEVPATASPRGRTREPAPDWSKRGMHPETDATRCALARDVLAGKAQRRSGVGIDDNDRDIARNDVNTYCR